jgi:hypothetical protein
MSRSLGIVVPAFRPDVERLRTYVRALDDRLAPATIRVELDAPRPDVPGTLDDLPATVHTSPFRRGKGAAVTAGFEALETDDMCFLDADGSTPPASTERVVDALERADLAAGSRRHPDATVTSHQTVGRRFLGDAFAWCARRLLAADLYDYQCGAKAISREGWQRVRPHLYEPGFAWDVEFVAMAAAVGLRVEEIPIEWEDYPGSTVSPLSTAVDMGRALLTARHRAKRLQDSRLHGAIAAGRTEPPALIDRDRGD